LLEDGLARCPDHPDLLLELAQVEYANGSSDRAVELARTLLALRPQEHRAERLLAHLGATTTEEPWRRTPEELWALAAGAGAMPAAVILDHREVRFLPGNLTEERTQRAILITSAAQADDYLSHTVPHVPERQRLRVIAARILRRDGSEVSARLQDTPRLAEPELNLFYDTRLRVMRFSSLEDGDLIELCWVLSETAEANETGPYKGGVVRLAHPAPTLLAEVELSGPPGLLPGWELVHLSAPPRRTEDEDGTVHLSWTFTDLPPIPLDAPPAPPLVVTPHLVYSNHPDWVELGDWYSRHVAPRTRASRQVEATAARLVAGLEERRLRVDAIARYVASEITYVGLELGEHRFRPFSADWVLSHRIGDCKDKAALLVALYESVGIPARMVLLRVTDEGPFPARLAVLEAFNHAVVYLPEDDRFIDGTAAGHDPTLPPAMDQGATALVVDGTASRLVTTPVPGAGGERLHYRLRPGDPGSVVLTLESSSSGEAADRRRAELAGTADPRRVSRWLQARFPGAELTAEPELSMPSGRDPATLRLEATLPRTALLAGGGIPTLPEPLGLVAELTPVEGRQSPLLVPVRPSFEWTLEVDLARPPRTPPQPVTLDGPRATLRMETTTHGTGYRVDGSLRVTPGLLGAADAAALRELLAAAERALARPQEVP
jgi:transglutaminase-like putative cysteine protease